MADPKIRVGIIGANPDRGWAATAHIPALKHLSDYELTAVSTSKPESARRAAQLFGAPLAFADHETLVNHPDIDLVVITVKVPAHHLLATAALRAGKHVFCEWPLGRTVAEAEELAALARASGVHAVVGLQARVNPGVRQLRQLIAAKFVGRVLSTSVVASGGAWGATSDAANAYTNDLDSGATMLRIPMGHFLEGVGTALGEFCEVSALTAVIQPETAIIETGLRMQKTAPDQVVISGVLGDRAHPVIASIHYRGGMSSGTNFQWEINGTEGDILVRGATGHLQFAPLTLFGARHREALAEIPINDEFRWAPATVPAGPAYNVAQAYVWLAEDIRTGGNRLATFEDALWRHRVIENIELAARTGRRQMIPAR
jgi:predicted dehydrogenase